MHRVVRRSWIIPLTLLLLQGSASPGRESAKETAVLAGGCFWGLEAVYLHVRGVKSVTSGYAQAKPSDEPSMRSTQGDAAEAVRVVYDPAEVSYPELLAIFFSVAHDPTQLNRQGSDIGPEYRSAIFATGPEQSAQATAFVDSLRATQAFPRPIVTEIVPLGRFEEAEAFHRDYVARHPHEPYVMLNDAPKLEALRKRFPDRYRP
jgi:peptide-methionine (S)-S-oxide reductase